LNLSVSDLPAVNAVLNSMSAVLLLLGFYFIRNKKIDLHRFCMFAAFICSILFLISYLVYHYSAGSKRFPGTGTIRTVYFAVLISHTFLAAAVPPLAVMTLVRAFKSQFDRHRRIAKWTLPIWLYVSVTGVVVYWMLYEL